MNDELMTVATLASPAEANIARSCLEAAGIPAFLAAEVAAVGLGWSPANAPGGVKLQVPTRQSEQAIAVLGDSQQSDMQALEQAALESGVDDSEQLEPPPTTREQNVDRALRFAMVGLLLFPPLEVYVLWLLVKVFLSDERLSAKRRRRGLVALAISGLWIIGFYILIRAT
jgi:hypothetical protein